MQATGNGGPSTPKTGNNARQHNPAGLAGIAAERRAQEAAMSVIPSPSSGDRAVRSIVIPSLVARYRTCSVFCRPRKMNQLLL